LTLSKRPGYLDLALGRTGDVAAATLEANAHESYNPRPPLTMIRHHLHTDLGLSCSAGIRAPGMAMAAMRAAGSRVDRGRDVAWAMGVGLGGNKKEQEAGVIAVPVIDGMTFKPHAGPAAGHEDPGG
jgi:hypothetical protein